MYIYIYIIEYEFHSNILFITIAPPWTYLSNRHSRWNAKIRQEHRNIANRSGCVCSRSEVNHFRFQTSQWANKKNVVELVDVMKSNYTCPCISTRAGHTKSKEPHGVPVLCSSRVLFRIEIIKHLEINAYMHASRHAGDYRHHMGIVYDIAIMIVISKRSMLKRVH